MRVGQILLSFLFISGLLSNLFGHFAEYIIADIDVYKGYSSKKRYASKHCCLTIKIYILFIEHTLFNKSPFKQRTFLQFLPRRRHFKFIQTTFPLETTAFRLPASQKKPAYLKQRRQYLVVQLSE